MEFNSLWNIDFVFRKLANFFNSKKLPFDFLFKFFYVKNHTICVNNTTFVFSCAIFIHFFHCLAFHAGQDQQHSI